LIPTWSFHPALSPPHLPFYPSSSILSCSPFFFIDTPPTEIYTLSLHDALPIYFVIDVDVAQGFFGQALAYRCHCRHRVAHVAHFFGDQSFFVLSRRHDSELFGQIFASDHGEDAVELERPSAIDAEQPRVRMGTAQEFRIDCAGKIKIVGVDSFPRALGHRIDLAERFTDHRETFFLHPISSFAASSTACKILV